MSTDAEMRETLRDMLNKWEERAAMLRARFPEATEDQIQQAVGDAFTRSLAALKK